MHKRARRDGCSCRNDAVGSALEKRGLGASFEGYYTFVGDLNVALSEVKEHAQPYLFEKNLIVLCMLFDQRVILLN